MLGQGNEANNSHIRFMDDSEDGLWHLGAEIISARLFAIWKIYLHGSVKHKNIYYYYLRLFTIIYFPCGWEIPEILSFSPVVGGLGATYVLIGFQFFSSHPYRSGWESWLKNSTKHFIWQTIVYLQTIWISIKWRIRQVPARYSSLIFLKNQIFTIFLPPKFFYWIWKLIK